MANNWYGYNYVVRGEKKHSGITQDRERRQAEHQTRWPGGTLQTVIGPVSEKEARAWEAKQTKTVTPER
jgi:hypothetical protein